MPNFKHSVQKYDEKGRPIPKGKGGKDKHINKYGDVIIFDSKAEYQTYLRLKEAENKGIISNLKLQVSFELLPNQNWFNNVKDKKEIIRKLIYIGDFTFERDGKQICLDCKGWRFTKDKKNGKEKWKCYYDDIYKIKKKLFLSKYPEYIFEET